MTSTTAEILTSSGDRDGSYEWATPQAAYDKLNRRFGLFTLDPAATAENAKCERFFNIEDDGLAQPWEGRVFCNPPYGRELGEWVAKAADEVMMGHAALVCMLIPARTDTKWWHDYVMQFAYRVLFVRGRIKFEQEGKDNSATFASVVVIFGPRQEEGGPIFESWVP